MDWTAIVIAIAGSSALTAVINLIGAFVKKKSVDRKALRLLILGEIREYAKYLNDQNDKNGGISDTDYKHFEALYETYKALDGDGYADKVHADVKAIQILF